jgi:deoxycytidine triphosphate deaminase
MLKGWKCDDFKGLCKILEHKGQVNRLVSDPTGSLKPEDLAKEENFSGNAYILHIGEVCAKLHSRQKTEQELIIPPGRFLFFMTRERVQIPLDIDGCLFMNPSSSNKGLLFFTLGHVDPGFDGHLTATLLNTTSRPIPLKRHEGILYLVLSRLEAPSKPHPYYHEHPQLSIDQAVRDLSYNLNPGFALTSANFARKEDLESLRNWIISAVIALFGIIVGVILALLPR